MSSPYTIRKRISARASRPFVSERTSEYVGSDWRPWYQRATAYFFEIRDLDDSQILGSIETLDEHAGRRAARIVTRTLEFKTSEGIESGVLASLIKAGARPTHKRYKAALARGCEMAATLNDQACRDICRVLQEALPKTVPTLPPLVEQIGRLFGLSFSEARIVATFYAIELSCSGARGRYGTYFRASLRLLSKCASVSIDVSGKLLLPGARLRKLGLVVSKSDERWGGLSFGLNESIRSALRLNSLEQLTEMTLCEVPPACYKLSSFDLPREEVADCIAAVKTGGHVLVIGRPGIGKTEFVRSLASTLGRKGIAPRWDGAATDGEHQGPYQRISRIRLAAALVDQIKDLLIIDEADSILQSAADRYGASEVGRYDKSELNQLLESISVPTIWISNSFAAVPTSALRRFAHTLEFPEPSLQTRTRILSEKLRDEVLPPELCEELASRFFFTPAAAERAAKIALHEASADEQNKADGLTSYFRRAARSRVNPDIHSLPAVRSRFLPELSNTSEALPDLVAMASRRNDAGRGLRILFSGPPGGGKTEAAKWLAQQMRREAMVRRPSDLLSMFVGEAEKQIAAAFSHAEQANAVLVLDEADALLYDRKTASRSWEYTQISEFLQQMQSFDGILVACTNRGEAIDPALRRRFHKHIVFGPLAAGAIAAALHHFFPQIELSAPERSMLEAAASLMVSDFDTAAEVLNLDEDAVDAKTVVDEIIAAAEARSPARKIGF